MIGMLVPVLWLPSVSLRNETLDGMFMIWTICTNSCRHLILHGHILDTVIFSMIQLS